MNSTDPLALAAQTLLNNWDNGEVVLQENMEALRDALASRATTQAPAGKACKYGDALCPCQDGDACHYEGEKPFTQAPAEPSRARLQLEHLIADWVPKDFQERAKNALDALDPTPEQVRASMLRAADAVLAAAPTPVEPALTTERHIAWREAHEIEKEDSYFKARQHLDDERGRHLFRMGFERGFDAGEKVYAAPAVEPGNPANQADTRRVAHALTAKIKLACGEKPTALNGYGIRLWEKVENDIADALAGSADSDHAKGSSQC